MAARWYLFANREFEKFMGDFSSLFPPGHEPPGHDSETLASRYSELSPQVFAVPPPVRLLRDDLEWLELRCLKLGKRVRFCAHGSAKDLLQEMFIALPQGEYIRPHCHRTKSESLQVLRGNADLFLFDDVGRVLDFQHLGTLDSGNTCFVRFLPGQFHMLRILSAVFVFHETTTGPFDPKDNIKAPWSPAEEDDLGIHFFLERLDEVKDG